MNEIFAGAAHISIQGERALRLLDCTGNQAKYEVIGFEQAPVTLVDSRPTGLRALQELLESGDLPTFAPKFNHPAYVRILEDDAGQVSIALSETDAAPSHMLWIVIGLGDLLPVYEYVYENLASLHPGAGYAFIGLYQLSEADRSALAHPDEQPATYASSLSAWAG